MNWSTPRLVFTVLISTFILGSFSSTTANAAITRIAGPTPLFSEGRQFVKFDVAYDEVNQVYLAVWGTQASGPVNGMFLNQSGVPITSVFPISLGSQQAGWARVAYSAQLGKFLVTYTKIFGGGNHQKAVRFVQYAGGGPSMPAGEITLDSWNGNAASEAGVVYSPAAGKFIVSWWVWQPNPMPTSFIALVDAASNTATAPILVSEPSDGESDPEIACDQASNRCLVVGFSWGVINGNQNTVWGRFVNATTGAAIGSVFVVNGAPLEVDPTVAFSAASGRFVVGFVRDFKSVWTMTVAPDGTLGAPQIVSPTPDPGIDGDGFGTINIVNNAGTGSFLMAFLSWTGLSVSQELDANGARTGLFDRAPTDSGDWNQRGKYVVPAADAGARQFLVSDNQRFNLGRSTLYSTGGNVAPPPPPSPPPSAPPPVQVTSFAANTSLPASQGIAITWTATTSGGSNVQYQFWRYTATEGWQIGQAYSSVNTFTWAPPAGTNAVQVWVRSTGSSAAYDAYAATGYFDIRSGARVTAFFANRSFPLPVHVPVTFTANASSGSGAVQYQFWRYSASTGWILAQDYSSSNSYSWFPLEGLNAMQVWVRTAGSTVAYEDYAASGFFTVSAAAQITALTANVPFPAVPGTPITWTAFASSGGGTIEYKFWGYSAAQRRWSLMRDWGVSNQLTWTPGANDLGQFAIQVWVRDMGASLDYEDWRGTELFTITQSTGLTLTMNRSLTGLRSGDPVTFIAQATGGNGNWEYAFWGYNGSAWVLLQPYTVNQNNFPWGVSAGTLAVQVWIRAPGSTSVWERWATTPMFVVTP